jgi:hypothetical protein
MREVRRIFTYNCEEDEDPRMREVTYNCSKDESRGTYN